MNPANPDKKKEIFSHFWQLSTVLPFFLFLFFIHKYIVTRYHHLLTSLLYFVIPFSLAFFYTVCFTPIFIYLSRKLNILSKPEERNETYKTPTALLGGVAIYLAFICSLITFSLIIPAKLASIIVGGSIILVLGTIDDITPLSSTVRLLGQLAASFIVMSHGLVVSFTPDTLLGNISAVVITLIWILGIINATNFLDGADGLASGIIMISSSFFFLITLHLEQFPVSLVASVMVGCCLGFLIFNFKPAKIYLGDGGSTFLGFVLACIALYGGWSERGPIIALGIPVIILGVLIFDMIYITAARILRGRVCSFKEWLDYTGKDHFHHRLIHLGFDERYAVVFIYILCVVLGFNALTIENAKMSYPIVLQLINSTLIFIMLMLLMLVGREKR